MQEGILTHLFKTANNMDYVDSHPEPKYYGADIMSGDNKAQFSDCMQG